MKRKRFEGGDPNGEETRPAAANSEGKERNRKSIGNNKRGRGLGGGRGGGLSLEAFVNAKSKHQSKFPSQIRERREFYSNAKIVQKYKKLRKQRDPQDEAVLPKKSTPPADGHIIEQGDEVLSNRRLSAKGKAGEFKRKRPWALRKEGEPFKSHRRKQQANGLSQIERIRKETEEKEKERDQQRLEKEEERAKQQEAKEKAQRDRKEAQAKLRKKTSRGQPVMKHQMERLLGAIQRQS